MEEWKGPVIRGSREIGRVLGSWSLGFRSANDRERGCEEQVGTI